jgi:hypothetical protein
MAAAGGLNIDDLLRQQDEDIDTRRKLMEYQKKLEEFKPAADDSGEDGMSESAHAAMIAMASDSPYGNTRSSVHARGGRMGLLSRNFDGADNEVLSYGKSGKKKTYVHNQRGANQRINQNIVKAMRAAAARGDFNSKAIK